MSEREPKKLHLLLRIVVINGLAGLQTLLFLYFYLVPNYEARLLQSKKEIAEATSKTVFSILTDFDRRVQAGELSENEAKKQASALVGHLRYGKDTYFAISSTENVVITNSEFPQVVGKDLSKFADSQTFGSHLGMVKVALEHGAGFHDYLWPHPGSKIPVAKTSYSMHFKPWNWVLAHGVYLDDAHEEADAFRRRILAEFVFAFVLSAVFTWVWW